MRVTGKIEVLFDVLLPDHCPASGMCDDPAKEAVLDALPQYVDIFLWGDDHDPARVMLDAHEEDVEIEEDERHET